MTFCSTSIDLLRATGLFAGLALIAMSSGEASAECPSLYTAGGCGGFCSVQDSGTKLICSVPDTGDETVAYLVWDDTEGEYSGFAYDGSGYYCCNFPAGSISKAWLYGTPNRDGLYFSHGTVGDLANGKGTGNLVGIIRGGDEPDNIGGSYTDSYDYSEELYGEGGEDHIDGHDGNDKLFGGGNNDFLDGGAGDDELQGGLGMDHLEGGADSDTLYGGADGDELDGGTEVDILFGEGGNDDLCGGTGSGETLYGNAGADTLYAGDTGDTNRCGGDSGDNSDPTDDTLGCGTESISACPF